MILQALTRLYEDLAARSVLQKQGWSEVSVSWALQLDAAGELVQVIPLEQTEERGKKTVVVPQRMRLPVHSGRSGKNPPPYFLCDKSKYVLGVDSAATPEDAHARFDAFRAYHEELLHDNRSPAAQAMLTFLRTWDPSQARTSGVLSPYLDDIQKSGNIVFLLDEGYAHEIDEIRSTWPVQTTCDAHEMVCLVTGQTKPVARTHNKVKGVTEQESPLVSFNCQAALSYGKEQGYNAPVSVDAAFAYTEALNWLIRDNKHHRKLDDTLLVFWAEGGQEALAEIFCHLYDGVSDAMLENIVYAFLSGREYRWNEVPVNPSNKFYILALIVGKLLRNPFRGLSPRGESGLKFALGS